MQHTATHTKATRRKVRGNTLQHTATHCNTLQHIQKLHGERVRGVLTSVESISGAELTNKVTESETVTGRGRQWQTPWSVRCSSCCGVCCSACCSVCCRDVGGGGRYPGCICTWYVSCIHTRQLYVSFIHTRLVCAYIYVYAFSNCMSLFNTRACLGLYGVALASRLLKIIGLFCKRAL